MRQVGDTIVLEPREVVERRLRERFKGFRSGVSLADELIAERVGEVLDGAVISAVGWSDVVQNAQQRVVRSPECLPTSPASDWQ